MDQHSKIKQLTDTINKSIGEGEDASFVATALLTSLLQHAKKTGKGPEFIAGWALEGIMSWPGWIHEEVEELF